MKYLLKNFLVLRSILVPNILTDRSVNKSQAVPNLLNITDGLLGDLLGISIICTFNSDLKHIDSALLRKGRIKQKYEFRELDLIKGMKLNSEILKPMVLADIYNLKTESFSNNRAKIGFNA